MTKQYHHEVKLVKVSEIRLNKYNPNVVPDAIDEKKAGKLKYYNRLRFNIIMIDQFYKLCTEVWLRRGVNLI